MNTKTRFAPATAVITMVMWVFPVHAQLWLEFAHPDDPHGRPPLPDVVFPELFADEDLTWTIPVVVILMEFSDDSHDFPANTPQRYHEMFFGDGDPPGSFTVADYFRRTSNGRITIVPADTEFHGTAGDGVIGWVVAQGGNAQFYANDPQAKRAEAIRRADQFMGFNVYDTTGNGVIEPHELIIALVGPGDGGGQTHSTSPQMISVDGGAIRVRTVVPGLGETWSAGGWSHEASHALFGLDDLYDKCTPTWVNANGDGYFCEILSDDCDNDAGLNNECGCPDALDVTVGESVVDDNNEFDNGFVPQCGDNPDAFEPVAWYEVFGSGRRITVTTCDATTMVNTHVNVYCNGCDGLSCVAGNDDDPNCGSGSGKSTVSFCGQEGVSYLIAVYTDDADTGPFELGVSQGNQCTASTQNCGLAAAHSRHWYPFNPSPQTIMATPGTDYVQELDPWAKIHLGFTKPKVITHDGTYTVYDAETVRSFDAQDDHPEAWIVYDPEASSTERYREYFIIENRNESDAGEQGLAVWLVNERWLDPFPGYEQTNWRRTIRLVHMGGHNPADDQRLWDGNEPGYYDLTPASLPRNTAWSDGSPSNIEIYDISGAVPSVTFSVRIPGIYVDDDADPIFQFGTQDLPYETLQQGIDAIVQPPRTIHIAAGNYPENITVSTPCVVKHWKSAGGARIGN